jgi:phosphatidylinositol 4-kinase
MPAVVADEVCNILVACTHRFRKAREAALAYARQILETFSALMCDRKVVWTLLEILTLMRRSCELQYTDEVSCPAAGADSSTRRSTSSIQTSWIWSFSWPTTMRFATRSRRSYTPSRGPGSRSPYPEPRSKCSPLYK